ncbi:anchored repeat-type ABC transporter ATP-binding subunit [Microbacterium sp. SLBN-146]|uniref:anchored repeat-type ABC transporter ATP-binding subunit n=1 Tax=Microbacterium sp. SLBN-146 TaxID=2768457 RepID=UPI0011515716|nr:anchored repeat-type ABC transporter ATP-binding subunit [Microbacterium sp. SLBN-146]TQJ31074.1 manganese/iron transport system ATP-binding protein [Microbacterium sp. SLBN-146]
MSGVLEVEHVSVDLARRRVLDDVSMRVDRGEFVGVLGPNGAGKTSLLRAILGMIPAASGTIRVQGGPASRSRSAVGLVPQRHEFAWDFPISIGDTVLTGRTALLGRFRRPRAADYRAADEALDRVGLSHLRDRPVGELSGGQRQRVLVARALALAPPLLLLDEPFTGLDMPTVEHLMDLFSQLAREGCALVMTTHDIAAALHDCSRVILLNRTVQADAAPAHLTSPELWMHTFQVRPDNPMLAVVRAASGDPTLASVPC